MIAWSDHKSRYLADTKRFANEVGKQLRTRKLHANSFFEHSKNMIDKENGVVEADKRVLWRVNSPAVILEAGVLLSRNDVHWNSKEESPLRSPARWRVISESILAAIDQECPKMQQRSYISRHAER
jgi:hypothetical protein